MRYVIVMVVIAVCANAIVQGKEKGKDEERAVSPKVQPHYRLGKAPKAEFKVEGKTFKIDPEAASTKQVRGLQPEHFDPTTRQQRVEEFYRSVLKDKYEDCQRIKPIGPYMPNGPLRSSQPTRCGPFRWEFVYWVHHYWPAVLRARWAYHHRIYIDEVLWAEWMRNVAFASEIGALQHQNAPVVVGYLPPEYASTSPVLIYNDEYLNAAYNPVPFLAVLKLKSLKPDEKTAWIGTATTESLVTKLSSIPGLFVAEPDQVTGALRDQKLGETDAAEPGRAAQLGKVIDVERVVTGSYVEDGDKVLFNLRIVDVQTGAAQDGVSKTVPKDHLLDALPELAASLAAALGYQPQAESSVVAVAGSATGSSESRSTAPPTPSIVPTQPASAGRVSATEADDAVAATMKKKVADKTCDPKEREQAQKYLIQKRSHDPDVVKIMKGVTGDTWRQPRERQGAIAFLIRSYPTDPEVAKIMERIPSDDWRNPKERNMAESYLTRRSKRRRGNL